MGKIKIIADSMSDISKELAKNLNITVIPITVIFDTEEYRDGIDLTSEEFYKKLEDFEGMPRTSQLTPAMYENEIGKQLNEGYETIIIMVGSSKASGTYQSALTAKKAFSRDDIHVIDSNNLSFAYGMIVVEAAEMVGKGSSAEEVLKKIGENIEKAQAVFSVDTLKFLHKNGRLDKTAMVLGTILNVKPVLEMIDGKVSPVGKTRGRKKAFCRMIERAKERGLKKNTKIALAHANDMEGLEELKEKVELEFSPKEIIVIELGATIGSHSGPGTMAIFFFN
ncbi:MAG: DegV family protein [Alkaliphilus sp.]